MYNSKYQNKYNSTIQQINATKGIKVQQKYTKLEKKDKQMLKEVL